MEKIRDGFVGEKIISLPQKALKNTIAPNYITHIGYFPSAKGHFRERKKGCTDNIFIYCVNGEGWYSISDNFFQVKTNQYFQIPATHEPIKYGASDNNPWTIYWLHYSNSDLSNFNQELNISPHAGPKDIIFNEKGIEIWREMYANLEMGYGKNNVHHANMCLYYFLATFLHPKKTDIKDQTQKLDLIQESIDFMRKNLHTRITVKEFANRHQLSESHFTALFTKSTGIPPLNYFTQLKIQKSCQLIFNTNTKIKDIAYNLGYSDAYYFSRLFKKQIGVSPEKYRSNQEI
ncbi:AraC family transcriptional regulator [Pedobacter sp. MW01-1-1]|uniref:AraC family transcriptional regulator n=1 Tax=Pedobacter sp. MW01-1-1 TaxID=3383027 RepID=UPI003FEEF30F